MLSISKIEKILFILLVFVICSGFSGLFGFGWKSHIPMELKSLGSIKIIYKVDGTHFFGPGGINEAFIVYSICDETVQKIQKEGLEYFRSLNSTKKYEKLYENYEKSFSYEKTTFEEKRKTRLDYYDDTRGLYKDWQATPIQDNEERWNRNRNKKFKALVRDGLSAEERWEKYRGKYRGHNTQCKDTSLCSFYGDYQSIPLSFKNNEILKEKSLEDLNFTDEIKPEYIDLVHKILNSPKNYFGYGEFGVLIVSPEHKKMILLYRD